MTLLKFSDRLTPILDHLEKSYVVLDDTLGKHFAKEYDFLQLGDKERFFLHYYPMWSTMLFICYDYIRQAKNELEMLQTQVDANIKSSKVT